MMSASICDEYMHVCFPLRFVVLLLLDLLRDLLRDLLLDLLLV